MYNAWQKEFQGRVDFLMIYINEAHAENGWKLGNHVCINTHTCIEDRQAAARDVLIGRFGCELPVLLDHYPSSFDYFYHSWPERYFIFKSSSAYPDRPRLYYLAQPCNEFGFSRDDLRQSIEDAVEVGDKYLMMDKREVQEEKGALKYKQEQAEIKEGKIA